MTNLLYTFINTLGENFKEWIHHTVESCMPLLDFHFCEKVLQMSLTILAETFKVAKLIAEKVCLECRDPINFLNGCVCEELIPSNPFFWLI